MLRRDLLKLSAGSMFLPALLKNQFAYANNEKTTRGRLIIIILQGGLDGLSAVAPIGDSALFDQRPDLIGLEDRQLTDGFAINNALKTFTRLVGSGEGSIVHATAFPYTKRSHFQGQNIIETGIPTPFASQTGWLGRALSLIDMGGRALSLDTPVLVKGPENIETIFPAKVMGANKIDADLATNLAKMSSNPDLASSFSKLADAARQDLLSADRSQRNLAFQAGKAMRASDGPVAAVTKILSTFDSHANQGADRGAQFRSLFDLDRVIEGYCAGLGERWSDSLIITLTEFGRTVKMNGSKGTDHGYGSSTFLAGGLLNKSQVVADWPGLKNKNLFEGRDLMATIDMRSVCCAALNAVYQVPHEVSAKEIFFDSSIPNIAKYIFS
jgi:uncharacterized protein (DUF1501 family)